MTPESEYIMGTCHKCGRPWLAGHVCDEISKQAREAMDDVVAASIEAAKRLFPEETGEPVFVGHAPDQPVSGVERGQGVRVHRAGFNFYEGVATEPGHREGRWFPTDEASLDQMYEQIADILMWDYGPAAEVMKSLFGSIHDPRV